MAIGRVEYRKNTNLEAVASAITSMGQEASKKDKPIVLGEKIKRISTDATATPTQVLSGQTFYSAGKKQQGNILIAGTAESPVSVSKKSNYDLSIFPPAKYFKGTTESGILVPIGTLRGQGYALQSEVDAKQSEVNTWKNNYNSKVTELANMTTDRNNWMNVANSKLEVKTFNTSMSVPTFSDSTTMKVSNQFNKVPKYLFVVIDYISFYASCTNAVVKNGTPTTVGKINNTVYLLIQLSVTASQISITYSSPYGCNSHTSNLTVIGFF